MKQKGGASDPRKAVQQQGGEFCRVSIHDARGRVLFEGFLNELRFSESLIIAKSILFFQDEDPCFIHRSAVVSRLILELEAILIQASEHSVSQVHHECPGYLDEYPGADNIRVLKTDPL